MKARLDFSFLKLTAIRVADFPTDPQAIRQLFQSAKAQGVHTIIAGHAPDRLALIENLAGFWDVNIAICGPAAEVVPLVSRYSDHLGLCLDAGALPRAAADIPLLEKIKGRPFVLVAQGAPGIRQAADLLTLLYHSKAASEKAEHTFPALVVVSGQPAALGALLTGLEQALEPVVAEEMYYLSAITPIVGTDAISEAEKRQVDLALPKQLPAKPRKPRRLLVLDLNTGYPGHASIAFANYAIDRVGKSTGAYTATFSNDLNNFKYERLKQYDAVFLNNTVGWHFADPALRNGLHRYVCEGGGVAGYHGAVYGLLDWKGFGEMLGASGLGANVRETDERAWLKIDDAKSPLTAAFPSGGFAHYDEYYHFTTPPYSRDHVHALLSVDATKTDMNQPRIRPQGGDGGLWRADNDYAVSWLHAYGSGRVFYTSLGHGPDMFMDGALVAHVFAGIQYALGDLRVDDTPNGPGASRDHAQAHCGDIAARK